MFLFGAILRSLDYTPVSAQQAESASLAQQNVSSNRNALLAPSVIPPTHSTVEVDANQQGQRDDLLAPYQASRSEVLSSAGAFGDFTRYLQVLPGVVWNTDLSNDVLVRGGHPSENLYVVDGIEVPNINHIALEGTSGGFTSMVDTSSIDSVAMKAGVYDAKYSSRLSSLISVHTRDLREGANSGELNLGIAGIGGLLQRAVGQRGGVFFSAHRSLLNFVTNDTGLNGTPIYTNGTARMEWSPDVKDHFSVLSISGADSINIDPCAVDIVETLNINTQYAGSRSTEGLIWQHVHTPAFISTFTGSYSTQRQAIGQQMQATDGDYRDHAPNNRCTALVSTDVYKEHTMDGISSLGYDLQLDKHGWLISVGAAGRLTRLDYNVAEPVGEQSPFSPSTSWTDSDTFSRNFTTGQTGTYAEASGHIFQRWTAMVGAREETFALLNAHLFEPRASMGVRISEHQTMSVEYGQSSQLAPYIDILSYSENAHLRPIRVEQFSASADLWRADWGTLSMQAYRKRYFDEPVSTDYPSLMLANMVDTLGQAFLWLPLRTGGHGNSEGLEMLLRAHWPKRFQMLSSTTYARTRYAAGDGVLRPGNFDVPLIANVAAIGSLPWSLELAMRETYASGRPYTPYDVTISEEQFRGIYDLTKVNIPRGSAYNRLDFEFNRNFRIHKGLLNFHGGVDNVLGRKNFLGYAWLDRCPAGQTCSNYTGQNLGAPMEAVYQMPLFPAAGLRFTF